MDQKIKFILVGLIGISVIFIFLFLQTLSSKQGLVLERNELIKQNESMDGKIKKLSANLREYENKIDSLNKELSEASKIKEEVERKYELANKEKEELVERLKSQQAELENKPEAAAVQPTDDYWAGILKAKTELELQLANMSSDLKSAQINNEQALRDKGALELELSNLKREKEDLKRQFDYNQKLVDSLSRDLVREKNDKNKIQETFSTLRSENTTLLQQLKGLNNRKINLEKKVQNLQEAKANLERKFNEMQTMLTDNLSLMKNLNKQLSTITGEEKPKRDIPLERRESVELPTIVVRPQPETSSEREGVLEGKVVAVNKDNNFIIIDRGLDTGVKVGDKFRVDRDGQHVADVEVIQARKNIAACDIKKEVFAIQIGDSVIE